MNVLTVAIDQPRKAIFRRCGARVFRSTVVFTNDTHPKTETRTLVRIYESIRKNASRTRFTSAKASALRETF